MMRVRFQIDDLLEAIRKPANQRVHFWFSLSLLMITGFFYLLGPSRASFHPQMEFNGIYWLLVYAPQINSWLALGLLGTTLTATLVFIRPIVSIVILSLVSIGSCIAASSVYLIEYPLSESILYSIVQLACLLPPIVFALQALRRERKAIHQRGTVAAIVVTGFILTWSALNVFSFREFYEVEVPTFADDHQNWLYHHHRTLDGSGTTYVASRTEHVFWIWNEDDEEHVIYFYHFDCDQYGLWCEYTDTTYEVIRALE